MKRRENIYDRQRYGTVIFFVMALVLVGSSLWVSNKIVAELAAQEHERMEVWAEATRAIVSLPDEDSNGSEVDIDLPLRIIEGNRTIPILLTDQDGQIITHRNFRLPEPIDSLNPLYISPRNEAYLVDKLRQLRTTNNVITIDIAPGQQQYLYYETSRVLRMLNLYPYVQLVVLLVFVSMVYYSLVSAKKAEQNKVWVGLSKETAHQLGTPISSLMAWMELLRSQGVDPEMVDEINKDVTRLSTIASRFGKIGSRPQMDTADVNTLVARATGYMASRISRHISLTTQLCPLTLTARLSEPLCEWVMENLIKNAVDAMDAQGSITVTTNIDTNKQEAIIEVTDTGKGMPRNRFKTVFNPGYTTKSRGWGLGLTLVKRIVEQYHGGRIYVAWSEPNVGTTFRIHLPLD